MSSEAVILRPGQADTLWLGGTQVAILGTAEQRAGVSSFEFRAAPGFDTGSHVHAKIGELFYVLDGEMELRAGEHLVVAGPGTSVLVPCGMVHAFANRSGQPARMLLVCSPAGHERYFRELAGILAVDGPPDTGAIAALRARYDTTQVSPLST